MVRYILVQRVFLYDTYMKYESDKMCWGKFRDKRVPTKQTVHNLVNKLRLAGLKKHKRRVLTEETSDDTGARFQHTPRKSLKRLAQETRVSKSNARR
jgi:hypothetical protein